VSAPSVEGGVATTGQRHIFAPAAYLACSWCWCIGMYLPVYLARDFGALSFLVFAIPNMVGAAAVGFIFRSSASIRSFALGHLEALRAFAWATILFHIVFLSGFMPSGNMWIDLTVGAVTILTAMITGTMARPAVTRIAPIVWGLSIALFLAAAMTGPAGHSVSLPPMTGEFSLVQLVLAAPAIWIGFLLCPVLDGTFLATREFHGEKTHPIFALAFGALFPVLILLTLGYAGRIIRHDSISAFTFAHFALQSGFTIGVQWWALRWMRTISGERAAGTAEPIDGARLWGGRILLASVGLAFGAALFAQNFGVTTSAGISPRRVSYDLMLALYGLVFPAYIMAIAIPPLIDRAGCAWVFLAALAVAGPLYWIAAFHHQFWAVPIGVGVVLVAPLFAPRTTPCDGEKNREIA